MDLGMEAWLVLPHLELELLHLKERVTKVSFRECHAPKPP